MPLLRHSCRAVPCIFQVAGQLLVLILFKPVLKSCYDFLMRLKTCAYVKYSQTQNVNERNSTCSHCPNGEKADNLLFTVYLYFSLSGGRPIRFHAVHCKYS